MEEPTEKDFDNLLARLRSKNPLWREQEEFGKLLMKHIDSFTPEEKQRYDELHKVLMDASQKDL